MHRLGAYGRPTWAPDSVRTLRRPPDQPDVCRRAKHESPLESGPGGSSGPGTRRSRGKITHGFRRDPVEERPARGHVYGESFKPDCRRGGATCPVRRRAAGGTVSCRSPAINLVGALRPGGKLHPGKTIVTVLCDSGSRYASKLWNPVFLRSKGLPVPPWLASQTDRDISDVMIDSQ